MARLSNVVVRRQRGAPWAHSCAREHRQIAWWVDMGVDVDDHMLGHGDDDDGGNGG